MSLKKVHDEQPKNFKFNDKKPIIRLYEYKLIEANNYNNLDTNRNSSGICISHFRNCIRYPSWLYIFYSL